MVKVSTLVPADGFEFCVPARRDDWDYLGGAFVGNSLKQSWRTFSVELVHKDEGRNLQSSDSPWLQSQSPVFTRSAAGLLEPILSQHGELLPLQCPEADLVLLNVTHVIDALDEAASTIARLPDGRILNVERYVLKPDAIRGSNIFKMTKLRSSPVFVTDEFVKHWRALGLRGLEFGEIWSAARD